MDGEKLDGVNERINKNVKKENINWEEAIKLSHMLCTNTEIRGFFGVSLETLNTKCIAEYEITWQEFYEMHSANGRIAIRRQQLKLALDKEKPNRPMLIHLGSITYIYIFAIAVLLKLLTSLKSGMSLFYDY